MSKLRVISGPYFPVFGLNTEIYSINLRIQSEYRKIRTRNNSVFGHFSRSASNHVRSFQIEKINVFDRSYVNSVKYGTETITSLGPKIWKVFPADYKELRSLSTFKPKIKK